VSKEENLNDIFARLSALGIEVLSMRNKVNRLEEIFMQLVEGRAAPGAGAHAEAAELQPGAAGAAALQAGARDEQRGTSQRAARQSQRGALDRLPDHRHSRVRAHHPHLGQDHRAVGGDRDAEFRDLRQPIGRRVGVMGGFDYKQYIAPASS